jgi:rhodanese-related sulfurtransferase
MLKSLRSTALAFVATIVAACGGGAAPSTTVADGALPRSVDVATAATLRDDGALVIDVREQSEWDEFHMPGATLIPLGQLASKAGTLPKDKPIVLVCRSGSRSATGRNMLEKAGFTNVTSMDGGMLAWRSAGLPVE